MKKLRIRVVSAGRPVADVAVFRSLSVQNTRWEYVGSTSENGEAGWTLEAHVFPLVLCLKPPSDHWDTYFSLEDFPGSELFRELSLEPIGWVGPLGWWHSCAGPSAGLETAGEGIRIGVVDSGFGPSRCLEHIIGVGALTDGAFIPGRTATRDESNHGTHVTGLLAARSCAQRAYFGIAPGAATFVVRVFPDSGNSASQDDIASAIEKLAYEFDAHLINVSLGNTDQSLVEREAIQDAIAHGTLVLAAAGNSGGEVEYPAAYPEVVAVGAIGKQGEGSAYARDGNYVASGRLAVSADGFYIADFSSRGPRICCVAPGVDIVSTVPSSASDAAPLAGMCGTSMATPIVSGALAILLSRDSTYLQMGPTSARSARALQVLLASCRKLGFNRTREGAGLPSVT